MFVFVFSIIYNAGASISSMHFAFVESVRMYFEQHKRPYTSVMIVPTGVGAAIGGYAGDALPVARTLANVVDCLISHPNV